MPGKSSKTRTKTLRLPLDVIDEVSYTAQKHGVTFNEEVVRRLRELSEEMPIEVAEGQTVIDIDAVSHAPEPTQETGQADGVLHPGMSYAECMGDATATLGDLRAAVSAEGLGDQAVTMPGTARTTTLGEWLELMAATGRLDRRVKDYFQ